MQDAQLSAKNAGPCPICGAQHEQHDILYQKWGYRIRRCRVCGLGSTLIQDQFDPTSLYDEDYFQGGRCDGYANYLMSERVLRAEFRHSLAYLRRYGPKGGRLLEIGCAYGFFLLEAQRFFECVGIEVSEVAVEFCQSRGLDVRCGVVDGNLLQDLGSFGAVAMLDVIEHLPNPKETLMFLGQALEENGWLMISTGNWDALLARAMGQKWRLMTPPQHLFYFSRRTLTELLERCGFRVIHCTQPWKLVPLGLAVYQLSARLGWRVPSFASLSSLAIPVNLFDTVRLVAQKG